MHFSIFGMTINSNIIVNAITHHGIPVFHTSEIHLKPLLCRESLCNLADIIAVYKQSERFYIVGIEIKEWDKRVHPKMAMEYLETYRGTCEYFYLAAKKFSRSTLELKDIGLFDLSKMKVVKNRRKAIRYLTANIPEDCLRKVLIMSQNKGRMWRLSLHLNFGMYVRNILREGGFYWDHLALDDL